MDSARDNADALVEKLLYRPPQTAEELAERTAHCPDPDLREALLERIERGVLDDLDAVVAGHVFETIGLGEVRQRLVDIVSNPLPDESDKQSRSRQSAFVALALSDEFEPGTPSEAFGLNSEQYAELAASVYASLFDFTEINLELVYDLGDMLLQEPADVRPRMFERLETFRTQTDVDAGVVYRPLLDDESYRELWPLLLDAVVDEGVSRDADWLERLAETAPDETAQQFRKAAMELRTRGLEQTDAPTGFALVGTPDGAGTFPLLVFVERDDEVFAGHNLIVRLHSRAVRDGFFVPNVVRGEIDDLTDDIEQTRATVLTEVPVELGLRLARRLLDPVDASSELPPETRLTLYRLEHLPDGGAELPEPVAADAIDGDFVRERFDRDACFESWFFDRTTLESAAVLPVPDSDEPTDDWKTRSARRLADTGGLAARITGNLEFVALWYLLDGDERAASQFAAVAEDADEHFASSLAMDLLLDHTIEAVREMQDYAGAFLVEVLGDDSLRANLHDYHLEARDYDAETEERYLNFMELSYRTLEELQSELPPELRPAPEQILEAAGPIGLVMADHFDASPVGRPDELAETASEQLREAGFDDRVVGVCVPELLTNGRLLAMVRD